MPLINRGGTWLSVICLTQYYSDERFDRPSEVDQLLGDSTKARTVLGWKPQVDFQGLVKMMVESDLSLARRQAAAARA